MSGYLPLRFLARDRETLTSRLGRRPRVAFLTYRRRDLWNNHSLYGLTNWENVMRTVLIAILVTLGLLSGVTAGLACPPGYLACGTRYCCPR